MTRGKSENIKLTMPVSESRDHIQGPATAPVTYQNMVIMNVLTVDKLIQ